MAISADPLNDRSPRHITLPCSDLVLPLQIERKSLTASLDRMAVRAGPAERSQGRKPAEPVAHSASLDGAPLVRQRPPMRSWRDIITSTRDNTLRCDRWRSETLILKAFSVRAAPARFIRCRYSAIQNNVQTNTYDPDGTERHRRFYLAVLASRDLRPNSPAGNVGYCR